RAYLYALPPAYQALVCAGTAGGFPGRARAGAALGGRGGPARHGAARAGTQADRRVAGSGPARLNLRPWPASRAGGCLALCGSQAPVGAAAVARGTDFTRLRAASP